MTFKHSPKMRRIIEQIAEILYINLAEPNAHFRLEMAGFDRLVVENCGRSRIMVAHYFEMNGDLVPEPSVIFFTGIQGQWIPTNITQSMTGLSECARINSDLKLEMIDVEKQKSLADFTEQWAENIESQGWIEHARELGEIPF